MSFGSSQQAGAKVQAMLTCMPGILHSEILPVHLRDTHDRILLNYFTQKNGTTDLYKTGAVLCKVQQSLEFQVIHKAERGTARCAALTLADFNVLQGFHA